MGRVYWVSIIKIQHPPKSYRVLFNKLSVDRFKPGWTIWALGWFEQSYWLQKNAKW